MGGFLATAKDKLSCVCARVYVRACVVCAYEHRYFFCVSSLFLTYYFCLQLRVVVEHEVPQMIQAFKDQTNYE